MNVRVEKQLLRAVVVALALAGCRDVVDAPVTAVPDLPPDHADAPSQVASTAAARSVTVTVTGLQITMTDLGVLPGGTFSTARVINNKSEVVGFANVPGTMSWDWLLTTWSASTRAVLSTRPYTGAIPEQRNDNGEMAGTNCIGGCGRLYKGTYWDAAGTESQLQGLGGTDRLYLDEHVKAHAINGVGQIAGAAKDETTSRPTHAVIWQNKDVLPTDLGFLGKGAQVDYSEAYGINGVTHVVGVGLVGSANRAFLWRNGKLIDIGALSGQVVAEAYAINNTGIIAGKSNFYPVIWRYDVTNASSTPRIQQLPIPAGFFSAQPTSVNDAGDVVGFAGSPNIDAHAVLWRAGTAFDLGVWSGGTYSVATGINDLGQIVGTGTVAADGLDHALVWTVAAGGGGGGGATTNTAPSASLQATSSTSFRLGGSLSVRASFTDADNGPWTYTLDWGDGNAITGKASIAGTISGIGPHVYTKSGTFKAKLGVTDSKGAVGSSSSINVKVR